MAESGLAFITTVYGKRFLPLLTPALYTVQKHHPGAPMTVVWQDLPQHEVGALAKAFPTCEFIHVDETIPAGEADKAAQKGRWWRLAYHSHVGRPLCFFDADMLVTQPLDEFLQDGVDVVYTWKQEAWPLNAGLLMFRDNVVAEIVLETYWQRTVALYATPADAEHARSTSGSVDQHAFLEILDTDTFEQPLTRRLGDRDLVFQGVPCSQLNETRSVPITAETHVIHYKGGWHSILLERGPFTAKRPAEACAEMHRYWLETAAEAHSYVARQLCRAAVTEAAERYVPLATDYEYHGILHSEMLAACAVCDALGAEVIIESGRRRAQSTLMFAKHFQGRPVKVYSIELVREGGDAQIAEQRLAPYEVELLYGDSGVLLPELLRRHAQQRVALLLDGPKGEPAVLLAKAAVAAHAQIVAVMLHDSYPGSSARTAAERNFQRVWTTDDPEFVAAWTHLDGPCLPGEAEVTNTELWRPYRNHGEVTETYGPTLAVILPSRGDQLLGTESTAPRQVANTISPSGLVLKTWRALRQGGLSMLVSRARGWLRWQIVSRRVKQGWSATWSSAPPETGEGK